MTRSVVLAVGCMLLCACKRGPASADRTVDRAALEAELLAAHEAALEHHRTGNWQGIAAAGADPSLNVSRGRVVSSPRAEIRARFKRYFAGATFTRYEDLSAPIARVSNDGSMGWVIAQVRVEGWYRDDDG